MGKNYLPFVHRGVLQVPAHTIGNDYPAYARDPVAFGSLDIGVQSGGRAILQDLCIYATPTDPQEGTLVPGTLGLKLGWLGKGYLTRKHMPLDVMADGSIEIYHSWTLPRPYRLFSKERLTARFKGVGSQHPDIGSYCGISFDGIRTATQEPYFLHDAYRPLKDAETEAVLDALTLRAPHDSDIDIYSVGVYPNPLEGARSLTLPGLQIEGPGRRTWFKSGSQEMGLTNYDSLEALWWLTPWTSLIKLGEEDGWFMHYGQGLLADIRNWNEFTVDIVVTLRGCLEVDDDRI
jgi:hypothetical protein